jgi:transposase
VRRQRNISPGSRGRVIGMLQAGATVKEAAASIGRSERAVRDLHTKYRQTGSVTDKPRSSRPPVLSKQQKIIIYRKARATPKIEYSELIKEEVFVNLEGPYSKLPSRSTLYWELKRHGLINHKAKKRPKSNRGHAALRLEFAREYCNFLWGRHTLKFSDECSVEKGSGANQEWCFRFPWEKWKPEMLEPTGTSRKPAQMV